MNRYLKGALLVVIALAMLTQGFCAFGAQAHHHEETAPTPAGPTVTLADLEQTALKNSPSVREAEAAVEAAEGRARQAGLYPNPTAGYTGEEIRSGPVTRGGQHGFFVEQTIPLGGKLGKRRDVV